MTLTKFMPGGSLFIAAFALLMGNACSDGNVGGPGGLENLDTDTQALEPDEIVIRGPAGLNGPLGSPMNYFRCAGEGNHCVVGGYRYMAFGANGQYLFRITGGYVGCDRTTFGGDPAPGVVKSCYFSNYGGKSYPETPTNAPSSQWPSADGNVAFGDQGVFRFKTVSGKFACNASTFGDDPLPGTPKHCYPALPQLTRIAREGEDMPGLGPNTPVAYGANGAFTFRLVSGTPVLEPSTSAPIAVKPVRCGFETFQTDPAPFVVKDCYTLVDPSRPGVPTPWVADEHQHWQLPFGQDERIVFGSGRNGNFMDWSYDGATSGTCEANGPPADPDYGWVKHCWGRGNYDELALHHAPVQYQDVNKSDGGLAGKADFMTTFDYDGDFNGRNNWESLPNFATPSRMYFSVVEGQSHYYIYYTAYHPRDWDPRFLFAEEHEHDTEGAIMLVRKDGTRFGRLEALVTVYHENWKYYRAANYIGTKGTLTVLDTNGNDEVIPLRPIDTIFFEQLANGELHARTAEEAEGHAIRGCISSTDCLQADDGIRYEPMNTDHPPDVPNSPPDGVQVTARYTLFDMDSLLSRRYDWPTFANPDSFNGDEENSSCGDGLGTQCTGEPVNGIWSHVSETDPQDSFGPMTGEDPARFFAALFSFGSQPEPVAAYAHNPFLHQKCVVGRRLQGSADPCVSQICSVDPACCSDTWSQHCVDDVSSVCGQKCTIPTSRAGFCTANICNAQNGPITSGCDGACAKAVCGMDVYCCQARWDEQCVAEVSTVCKLRCDL